MLKDRCLKPIKMKDPSITYQWIYRVLERKIRKDFGKPCKDFCYGCSVCDAYMMLSILESMIDLECWDYMNKK
jgi:hypothetical protein